MEKIDKMTIEQLIDSEEFRQELAVQIENETDHHDRMMREAFNAGMRLQRAPIARLRERGVLNAEDMAELYKHIICKSLDGYSAAEREYIKNVCMVAYWRVIERNKPKK